MNFLGLNFLILNNVPCLSHARVSRLSSAFLHVACELFSICVFHLSSREFGDVSFTATLVGFLFVCRLCYYYLLVNIPITKGVAF